MVGRESWRRSASTDWRLLRFAEEEKVELWQEFMFWQNSHQIIGSLWFCLSYLPLIIFASLLHCCAIATALWYRQNISQLNPTFGFPECVKFFCFKKIENHKEKKSISSESKGGWLKKEEDGLDLGQIWAWLVCSLHLSGKDPNYRRKKLHHTLPFPPLLTPHTQPCPTHTPSSHSPPSTPQNCFLWPSSVKSSHLIQICTTM